MLSSWSSYHQDLLSLSEMTCLSHCWVGLFCFFPPGLYFDPGVKGLLGSPRMSSSSGCQIPDLRAVLGDSLGQAYSFSQGESSSGDGDLGVREGRAMWTFRRGHCSPGRSENLCGSNG